MIKSEIEAKYGKEMAEKIFASRYMQGVTCGVRRIEMGTDATCVADYYEDDVERAYRDVTGKFVHPMEWD